MSKIYVGQSALRLELDTGIDMSTVESAVIKFQKPYVADLDTSDPLPETEPDYVAGEWDAVLGTDGVIYRDMIGGDTIEAVKAVLSVTTTVLSDASLLPAEILLTSDVDPEVYQTTVENTLNTPTTDIEVTAVVEGIEGNLEVGAAITFDSDPVICEQAAVVASVVTPGVDAFSPDLDRTGTYTIWAYLVLKDGNAAPGEATQIIVYEEGS